MPRYVKYFLFLLIFGGFSELYLRSLLLVPKFEHTIKVLNQVTFPTKKEGFRYQWLRQRNDRLNWRAILLPCQGRTEWSKTSPGWGTANRTSANTSYISYLDIRPAGQFSRFFIQTQDVSGRFKGVGGDSWHIFIRGSSSVSATVFDHTNGTYEVLFLLLEPGNYSVEIRLDTTQCDGLTDPPSDWFIKGNAQGKFQSEGSLGRPSAILHHPFRNNKRIVINIPHQSTTDTIPAISFRDRNCKHFCNFLWDGFGRWKGNQWKPYIKAPDNWTLSSGYNRSGILWVFGDSLGDRFLKSISGRALCRTLYANCTRTYNWVYPLPGDNLAKARKDNDDLDFDANKILDPIRRVLSRDDMNKTDSTFLINAGLHLACVLSFTQYQNLIDRMVKIFRETVTSPQGETVPRFRARVIWKTTTATFLEHPEYPRTRFRFITEQVSNHTSVDLCEMIKFEKAKLE